MKEVRDAFEAWMGGSPPRICSAGSPCHGEYADQRWRAAWAAFLAGRHHGISDSIDACNETMFSDSMTAKGIISNAIRRLYAKEAQ